MRIFKIKKVGIVYKVYEALQDARGLIVDWKFTGSSLYYFVVYNFVHDNGREYNEFTDRVAKTWDGYGRYMKSSYNNYYRR